MVFNKWKKISIGIDFGIGIDQNSWYRTGIVSKPKKLVSPITNRLSKPIYIAIAQWSKLETSGSISFPEPAILGK